MPIMRDFARLPNQRKVLVFAVVGLLGALLYWQFGFKKLNDNLDNAQAQHDQMVTLSHKLDSDIKDFNDLKPTVNRLKAQIDQNEKALPTESELPAFFETLNRKVTESGVQVNRSLQKPEQPIESFIKVPVDFEISGTFMQIKRFFASLVPKRKRAGEAEPAQVDGEPAVEDRERIVSIENLVIGNAKVKNREIVLTAKFTAMTYRQEERAEAAPAKPVPGPARGGAAPAKPLPPAATPRGAKVRANNAMDKDEQRTDKGDKKLKGGM